MTSQTVAERLEREKQFHNQEFSEHARTVVDKYYAVTRNSRGFYTDLLLADCRGKRVLEYGCGPGSAAFSIAEHGGEVLGIDISDVAIRQAAAHAASLGLDGASFAVMNAEALECEDASFDLICGTGILHHLDLAKAFSEIARTLKPGGKAVFLEPLGHNPLINLYRRLTPALRTEDEHPLLAREIEATRRWFGGVEAHYHHIFSLAAVPFRNSALFAPVLGALERVDRTLFSAMPFSRRYAWMVTLVLSGPRRSA